MHIGYLSTIYHTSFLLKNKPPEYLKRYHQDWFLYSTGPALIEAFIKGEIDLGYLGLPPAMIGIENGLKIKCVGGGHIEGTVMIGSGSFQTYDELKDINAVLSQFEGKKIGTPSKGSIHDILIRELTEGLDISVINYTWADFIPEALQEGEIAAGVGTPSLATAALQEFNSKIIIPPSEIWPYNPSYGIVVKEELFQENQEYIMNFLKAHEDASNLIRKQPETAAKIALKEIGVLDKSFILNTYNISPRYCASLPEKYINSTLKFIPVLQDLGYLQGNLNRKDIFKTCFIDEIHPETAHY